MLFRAVGVLHVQQPVKPALLFLAGHRVGHGGRGRAGARGEDEGEQRVELRLTHQRDRVHRLFLRLAGEADDHVRGQHEVGHHFPGVVDQLQIARAGVGPVHRTEHAVVAGLDGQVQVFRHVGAARHRVEELGRGVLGLAGHEAQPVVAGDGVDGGEQVGKIIVDVQIVAVAVHVLTQQRDLAVARLDQLAALGDDLLRVAAALASAHIGHDAVRAEVVAPVHDRHPRAHAALAHHGQTLGDAAVLVRDGKHARSLGVDLIQKLRQPPFRLRPQHEIHMAVGFLYLVSHALLLRHAAAQADDLVGVGGLGVGQLA